MNPIAIVIELTIFGVAGAVIIKLLRGPRYCPHCNEDIRSVEFRPRMPRFQVTLGSAFLLLVIFSLAFAVIREKIAVASIKVQRDICQRQANDYLRNSGKHRRQVVRDVESKVRASEVKLAARVEYLTARLKEDRKARYEAERILQHAKPELSQPTRTQRLSDETRTASPD